MKYRRNRFTQYLSADTLRLYEEAVLVYLCPVAARQPRGVLHFTSDISNLPTVKVTQVGFHIALWPI